MGVAVVSEDLPEEHNRVELDPELTDSNGIPAPKVIYRQGENNKKLMAHGREKGKEFYALIG